VRRGPNTICRVSFAPVRMLPPAKLGLPAAKPAGVCTRLPSTRSRKPGANRSICAMIASVASPW